MTFRSRTSQCEPQKIPQFGSDPTGDRLFYGWYVVVAAFVTLMFTVGLPFYGMPFFYDYFIRDFGWTRGQTTSGIALATLLIQPIGGLYLHRFSARKLILFGGGMLALAMVAFGLGTGNLILYYLAWCAFMAGYMFAGPLPNQVILSQWFRKNRGLAIGIAYLGLGVGGAISQKYVALPLIQHFGWRHALMIIGALLVLIVPMSILIVRDRPQQMGLFPDGDLNPTSEMAIPPRSFNYLLRDRCFWLLAVGSCMSIGAIGSINQHMKLLFQDAGLSASTVADTTFAILISSLFGRVVMGWLADRLEKKWVMVAAYFLVAAPVPLLFIINHQGVPPLFAIIFGFGLGADYMLIPLMAAEIFGANSLARTMGILLPANSIGQTCFPFALGVMHDKSGNYDYGLIVVFALALIGALSIAFLPKQRNQVG